MSKFTQGRFKPKNPQKYKGDPSNIIYRSSWELKLLIYLDKHPSIEWYASEELSIPYVSPIDGKRHRYYADMIVRLKNGETLMIEVKPAKQTVPPQRKMKKNNQPTKTYISEVRTWGINSAKWEAARSFCKAKGWRFVIMTEKELGIK